MQSWADASVDSRCEGHVWHATGMACCEQTESNWQLLVVLLAQLSNFALLLSAS
jgi:hypothetical protein